MEGDCIFGIDFGTDSVRSILVEAASGKELASSSCQYPRWQKGLYCDPANNQYRQHPLDYIEGVEQTIKECLEIAGQGIAEKVKAIGIGTTGSTPCAVSKHGIPLALTPGFEENPNALFILWKDHTAIEAAVKINTVNAGFQKDYLQYVGGVYSSEWFWAKMLHVSKVDKEVATAAETWMEHSDWMPFYLTGKPLNQLQRNICAAGHKGLWSPEFSGLPPREFFKAIDPYLEQMAGRHMGSFVHSVHPVGTLSTAWANKLGLSENVILSAGIIDAHAGAIGAEIHPYEIVKIVGTSTCDIAVMPPDELKGKTIAGISGQVPGSVLPDYVGLEAGQSAFGDIFQWFVNLLNWTAKDQAQKSRIFERLSREAAALPANPNSPISVDWFNGRRTPDADQHLSGGINMLTLGSEAPAIFKSLIEAACLGSKKINDCFLQQGITIKGVTATGGIAKKSPLVMQMLADILQMPIKVHKSENTCALGAAINAAMAAGLFEKMEDAMAAMGQGHDREYTPNEKLKEFYLHREQLYDQSAEVLESLKKKRIGK